MPKKSKKRTKAKPVAAVGSDIHLSHTPPISRSVEKNWYAVQARYLDEIHTICWENDVCFFIPGDLFHVPDPPPSLINLVITHLTSKTDVYAVAGQHDLFHHNTQTLESTAYGTLSMSGQIEHVHPDGIILRGYDKLILLYGQSWEQNLEMPEIPKTDEPCLKVLLSHKFCYWPGDKPFPDVDPNQTAWDYAVELGQYGFDVAFFGDHHQDFIYQADDLPTIVNCGSILLRSATERHRKPKVYLLHDDGSILTIPLKSVEQDKWVEDLDSGEKLVQEHSEISEFITAIREIQDEALLSFEEAVLHYLRRRVVSEAVRVLLLKSIGRYDGE